jgi:hypothetical protein
LLLSRAGGLADRCQAAAEFDAVDGHMSLALAE